jgi:arylsulfatase A-like enzyme/thioredoxin-like negative regulator of GroEL
MARKQSGKKRRTGDEPEPARPEAASPAAALRQRGRTSGLRPGVRVLGSRTGKAALAALFVLIAGVVTAWLFRLYGPAGRRTPIILVSIDTLRADRLPAYGYGKIQTPAIDELAGNGVVFDNCYTHVPLTLPAHTSLFTGLLPPVHGVRNNIGFRVAAGTRTLATELKQAGYSTGGAVSASVLHSTTGISQGFDWFDDDLKRTSPEVLDTEIQRDGMETLDRALSWLAEQSKSSGFMADANKPVFLFVHLFEPHTPYTPPKRFWRQDRAPYDGEVAYADEIVSSLLAGLRRLKLYDSSLIILLSDHGEALGDHGEADHGVFLYREVMHVPLIIKLPGQETGGSRVQDPVQLIDIVPTVMDWVGLPQDAQRQGKSLVPALRGEGAPKDRQIYAESLYGRLHFGWKELFSLTTLQYSFVLAPRQELYDIRQDPGQLRNLLVPSARAGSGSAALPGQVSVEYEKLHRKLKSYVAQTPLKAPNRVDEEELKKLRALGYIGSPTLDSTDDDSAPDPKDRIGDLLLYRQAIRVKKIHMYSRVAETLQEVVRTSPRMIDAWDELSEAQQRLGNLGKAADALKQSLRIAPRRTRQLFELVDILTRLRRFDEARDVLRMATAQRPGEVETRRAFLEIVEGRPEAARETAGRAARDFPAAVPFVEGVLAYGNQEYSRALPLFRRAFGGLQGRSPHALPYIHFYLGDALARESGSAGDMATATRLRQEAEPHLRSELSLNPTNSDAATSLCFLHARENDVRKVHEVLGEFARGNPSTATYELIAHLYRSMKLEGDAARWMERARLARGR